MPAFFEFGTFLRAGVVRKTPAESSSYLQAVCSTNPVSSIEHQVSENKKCRIHETVPCTFIFRMNKNYSAANTTL